MTKALLFPYHPDIDIIAKHKNMLNGYEIVGVISYKDDDKVVDNLHAQLGIERLAYELMLEKCDEIIVLENYRNFNDEKYYQVIEDALAKDIRIVITPSAEKQLDLCKYVGQYETLKNSYDLLDYFETDHQVRVDLNAESILYDIPFPVVGIMGMGKNCGKFETELLAKNVLEENFDVITLSSNPLGVLFGTYTFPQFFYEDISLESKILRLNHHLKRLTDKHNADVILIGMPEGIGPFRKAETNHFAEYALAITSAVQVDIAILCTYFLGEGITSNSIADYAHAISKRFGARVIGVAMSRTMFEVSAEEKNIVYEFLDEDYIDKYYPDVGESNDVVFVRLDNAENARWDIKRCISILAGNVAAI